MQLKFIHVNLSNNKGYYGGTSIFVAGIEDHKVEENLGKKVKLWINRR